MLLGFAGILIMGGGAFYLGWNLFSGQMEAAAAARLQAERKPANNSLLRINRPIFRALVMPYSMQWKRFDSWKKKHKRLIISAGLEDELDADELLAFKISMGFVIPIALALFALVNGSSIAPWLLASMCFGGYIYPTAWVKGCRKNRHEEIALQLPFVIDLLTLATEAGLDFIGAIQKVVEKTRPGPLVNELERMLQQIQLGTTRGDSLRDMGWRIDLGEIASLVAVLVTADQMGSPLGPVLRVQSDLIRTQRFTKAEKKGAAASQKLLFPLIFFIMPAVFIMIFGPVILGFLGVK